MMTAKPHPSAANGSRRRPLGQRSAVIPSATMISASPAGVTYATSFCAVLSSAMSHGRTTK
jgi:hypothetical protein